MTQRPIPLRPAYEPAHVHLERAAFAAMSAVAGRRTDAAAEARRLYPSDPSLPIILRADVTIGTSTTPGWAAEVAAATTAAYLADLAPQSAIATLMTRGLVATVPIGRAVVTPARVGGPVARSWVGEGAPIPVSTFTFGGISVTPYKLGVLTVLSRELVLRASGEVVLNAVLRDDAAATLDGAYLNDDAATGASPAGLLYGVSPLTSAGEIWRDLAQLAAAVGAGGSGELVFITGPGRAAAANLRADLKATVLPSTVVAEGTVIAIDPRSIIHAVGEQVEIDAGEDAVVHMSDEPLPISDGGVADPVRSMFQTACLALRMIVDVGYAKRRAGAVAMLTEVIDW